MTKAFVFGKFMPFHNGHRAMIEYAAEHCDELIVLPCISDKESISGKMRKKWIEQTFKWNSRIKVKLFNYKESELPNTSVSSNEVSKIWSEKFKKILADVNLLVTSEPYGELVASFMNIRHLNFDISRTQVPVSATKIRNNPFEYWDFLPDAVKPYYQRKVVILGTESSGKTTLAEYLSTNFNAALVREMGRALIPNSEKFEISDLKRVAAAHQKETAEAIQSLKPLIVMDTDIHITQSYAFYKFGQYLDLPKQWYRTQKADLYLFLPAETPYVQDGSRLSKAERNELGLCHSVTLEKFGIGYHVLSEDFTKRKKEAEAHINQLLGPASP
jgi:HTH-type transcriptional regulator, transcriptional repressor of NAD biosynthesis genes